jgi:hypothetical protein
LAPPVEIASDGTLYFTVLEQLGGDISMIHIHKLDGSGDVELTSAAGVPTSSWNPTVSGISVGDDGTVFVTVTQYEGLEIVLTKIRVLPAIEV